MITNNAGNQTKADFTGLLGRCDVLCGQEFSDRDDLYRAAEDAGWRMFNGGGADGKKATPVFWNPHVGDKVESFVHKLSDAQTVNPGTGPEHVKAKYSIGIGLEVEQKRVNVGTLHLVPDSSHGERHQLARRQITEVSGVWAGAKFLCVHAGDWNTSWNNDLLDPMRNKGWKSNQYAPGGPVHTHGNWTPDQAWFRNGTVLEMGKIKTKSDHDALWVRFGL